jgi:8-oxo-dGTP diphosphatase
MMTADRSGVADYDPRAYPAVAVTVDVIVLTLVEGELRVVLVQRGEEPFAGEWALPGGFIRADETLDEAAARELREETALRRVAPFLDQVGAYGDPDRDPRMRVVTVSYLAIVPNLPAVRAGSDARRVELVPVRRALGRGARHRLAFDHRTILADAVETARHRLETTSIATSFLAREFTLTELRRVYEAMWDCTLDPGNFRRKVLATREFVEATGEYAAPGPEGGKPPELFRAGKGARLDPPLRRPG